MYMVEKKDVYIFLILNCDFTVRIDDYVSSGGVDLGKNQKLDNTL